jgi:hypothetical protein
LIENKKIDLGYDSSIHSLPTLFAIVLQSDIFPMGVELLETGADIQQSITPFMPASAGVGAREHEEIGRIYKSFPDASFSPMLFTRAIS